MKKYLFLASTALCFSLNSIEYEMIKKEIYFLMENSHQRCYENKDDLYVYWYESGYRQALSEVLFSIRKHERKIYVNSNNSESEIIND
jgi:hypothetical protein